MWLVLAPLAAAAPIGSPPDGGDLRAIFLSTLGGELGGGLAGGAAGLLVGRIVCGAVEDTDFCGIDLIAAIGVGGAGAVGGGLLAASQTARWHQLPRSRPVLGALGGLAFGGAVMTVQLATGSDPGVGVLAALGGMPFGALVGAGSVGDRVAVLPRADRQSVGLQVAGTF